MTEGSWIWVALAAAVAVLDWIAVGRGARRVELAAKPAVLALLIAAASQTEPDHAAIKPWLIAALTCGLIGDIALLGATESGRAGPATADVADNFNSTARRRRLCFLLGLGAFAIGHLCYVGAMLGAGVDRTSLLFGAVLAAAMLLGCGHRIVIGAYRAGGAVLAAAVVGYTIALAATVTFGVGTSLLLVGYGSVLFAASDLVLGYDRFVRDRHWSRVAVIVTYHLAQLALLIGLTL